MMMQRLRTSLTIVLAIAVTTAANAHPGHGQDGSSFSGSHYLTEPLHVFGAFILFVGFVAGGWLLRRRRRTLTP